MPDNFIIQAPETPVTETLRWITDVIVADNGEEQSISLTAFPKRSYSGELVFDAVEDVRRFLATSFSLYDGLFFVPMYQLAVPLKAAVNSGTNAIQVNSTRSDFRVGQRLVIVEGDTYESLVVNTVTANSVTVVGTLANSYSMRARAVPMLQCHTSATSSITRRNPDNSATATFNYSEYAPQSPYVSPLNTATVPMFDSLPVLDKNSIGTEFEDTQDTGIEITEFLGLPEIRARWNNADRILNRTFKANKVFKADWDFWQVFFDAIKGNWKPFLLPTFRNDLEIETAASGGDSTIDLADNTYSEYFEDIETFTRIVIDSDAGRHYASITAVADNAGKDRLTISPALPTGAGWDLNQKISFLLKVRLSDDTVSIQHYALHALLTLSIRTTE